MIYERPDENFQNTCTHKSSKYLRKPINLTLFETQWKHIILNITSQRRSRLV